MDNVQSIITKHNAHIIRNSQSHNMETGNCNCDNKNTSPLPKQCLTNNIIYKTTVTTNNTNDTKHYIGITATTFQERHDNHTSSFRHKKDSNKTKLSKHIWKLKENNQDYTIKWSILKHVISYTGGSKRCNLCLEETFCILKDINKDNLLNKRTIYSSVVTKTGFK
jgi:hypothetical protein